MSPPGCRLYFAIRTGGASPSFFSGQREKQQPSLPPVAHRKLPPCGARQHDVRVCSDELNLILAITDHEEDVCRETQGRNLDRVSTGAVSVHGIRALLGHRDDGAVQAYESSARHSAVSVESFGTHIGQRARLGGRSRTESSAD